MACRVILDTNFLLIPASEGVDIFEEFKQVVSSRVEFAMMNGSLKELDDLEGGGLAKHKAQVKLVKVILSKKTIHVIPHDCPSVDDAIVLEAVPGDIVATMDKELRARLKKNGVDTAVLRKRQHVVILEA